MALPEREFGVRDKWDGVAKLGGKVFKFKHPKRLSPAGKKKLKSLLGRERKIIDAAKQLVAIDGDDARDEAADRIETEHRELNLDHLALYLGDVARAELASDEENYPADELALLLKFIMESKAADEPLDPLGSESQVTLIGTSSLPA